MELHDKRFVHNIKLYGNLFCQPGSVEVLSEMDQIPVFFTN